MGPLRSMIAEPRLSFFTLALVLGVPIILAAPGALIGGALWLWLQQ